MRAKTVFTECYLAVATNLFDGHLREKGDLDLEACSLFVESVTGHKVTFSSKPPCLTHPALSSVPLSLAPASCAPSHTCSVEPVVPSPPCPRPR